MSEQALQYRTNEHGGSLVERVADRYGVDPGKLMTTLKSTAFKQRDGAAPTNEQMMALLIVADQYGLNPFLKEIYAFPDKQNGIVPVVGVDGWSRIINSHPQFDGMEFRYSDSMVRPDGADSDCHEWVECVIYRKDRRHPVAVREYLSEVYRPPFTTRDNRTIKGPWQSHPKRFLRHKATIQCSRLAFGFAGIFDQDEAERIQENQEARIQVVERTEGPRDDRSEGPPPYPEDQFAADFPKWEQAVSSGVRTADQVIAMVQSKGALTEGMKQKIRDAEVTDAETGDPY